ncbi:hypothetical protein MPPM_3843 [Methylorubrum populi]|uniref:Uncharacterized protein n=1 Tax=Methylorubrum populi TaxID=223967 RepID=A0A169RAU7_9HYPH|nr:hypothetical protein [Methylorubrum populi]BAU92448.1 hypothetical protein MPPM_3843 [Methylorubrum populi]
MADPSPSVGELFKAKAVTDEQVSALVDAVLAGKLDERAELAEGYALDVAAAVKASLFATSVLADETSKPGARRNAVRTAVLLARAEKA